MSEQWGDGGNWDGAGTQVEWAPGVGGPPGGAAPLSGEAAAGTRRRGVGGGAIAAMVLGALLLLLLGGVIGAALTFFVLTSEPAVLTVGLDGDVEAFDLAVGECGSGLLEEGGTWVAADAVPCEEAHDFEVYAAVVAPEAIGERYPDGESLAAYGDGLCLVLFEPYVGRDWWHSALDFEVLVPTAHAWAGGERSLHCVLSRFDEQMVGSARGSSW